MEDLDFTIILDFICEAKDLAASAEKSILALEDGSDLEKHLGAIFRMAHNVKGSGRAVGFTNLGDFVHKYEDVIGMIRNKEVELNSSLINLLLETNDFITKYLDYLADGNEDQYDTEKVEKKLDSVISLKDVEQTNIGKEVDMSQEVVAEAPAEAASTPVETAPAETPSEAPPASDLGGGSSPPPSDGDDNSGFAGMFDKPKKNILKKSGDEIFKVKLSKLDAIIDSLGELLIYQSMLNESRKHLKQSEFESIHSIVDALNGITKEMQDLTITLRMLPLLNVFQKMNRIVRELSLDQKKEIKFITEGEHVELDKLIVDSLSNPLTHMIRNAIDHGIETPEQREENNKPRQATLCLRAQFDAGVVKIVVEDDGRGLDREKIIKKAMERGILNVPPSQLSDQEVYRFIMESGFSTREQVTDLSGRGVGMDVVRETIEGLNGKIEINSEAGKGTKFTITLPLSLSIIEGMIIMSQDEKYIVPLAQMAETIEVDPTKVGMVNTKAMVLRMRKDEIPLFSLNDVLNGRNKSPDVTGEDVGIVTIVDGMKYAFIVDRILGPQSVVIKELGLEFKHITGLAGSAILGDGQPGLILDLSALISKVIQRR